MANQESQQLPRLEVALSKKKMGLSILYDLVLFGAGIYLFIISNQFTSLLIWVLRISALIGVVFFGFSLLFFLIKLMDRKPGLILDQEGLVDNADVLNAGRINWDNMVSVEPKQSMGQQILLLKLHEPEQVLQAQPWIKKIFMQWNQWIHGTPVTLSSAALEMDQEKLLELINQNKDSFQIDLNAN